MLMIWVLIKSAGFIEGYSVMSLRGVSLETFGSQNFTSDKANYLDLSPYVNASVLETIQKVG